MDLMDFELTLEDDPVLALGKHARVAAETCKAYGRCGTSYSCSGGGGQCGTSYSCSGGGGQCGTSYDCSGGGGRCGTSYTCSGR